MDTNTNVEQRPGRIIYTDWGPYDVWNSDKREYNQNLSAITQLLSTDVDKDGRDELLFGTFNGSLIVLDVPEGTELMNMSFGGRGYYPGLAVGNLDSDEGKEIVFFDGATLRCIDFRTRSVQWSSPIRPCFGPPRTQGPMSLIDPDGDGIDDILLRTQNRYYRLDGNGGIINNVSLDVFREVPPWAEDYLGWDTKMIVDDLDMDGDEEVFISDWGYSLIPEVYNRGQHVWMIGLASGEMEYFEEFNMTYLMSDPMLFTHEGRKYVAIGLDGWLSRKELLVIDIANRSWEFLDVRPDSNMSVDWISLIPSQNDTVLLLVSDDAGAVAWSFGEKKVLWSKPEGTMRYVESPTVICDIDNDTYNEVLLPVGPVHIIDVATGGLEKSLEDKNVIFSGERTAVGDFDGDGFTEICQGLPYYLEHVYRIVFIDTHPVVFDIQSPKGDTPRMMYAGLPDRLSILIGNMTAHRIPPRLELTLSNPAWGVYAEFRLNPTNGTHEETLKGPIALSGYSLGIRPDGAVIDLTLLPGWAFAFEGPNDLTVSFVDQGEDIGRSLRGVFAVERDLVLVGDGYVGMPVKRLVEWEWLRPLTSLRVEGLDIIYEGTDSLHPPRDSFALELFDGLRWDNVTFIEGEPLGIGLSSPAADGPFEIRIAVNQVAAGKYGLGSFGFWLRVDGSAPFAADCFPHNSTWLCDEMATVALLMADNGSGVEPLSVEYCKVADSDAPAGLWQHAIPGEMQQVERGLIARLEMSFGEGTTYVLWRFEDRMGLRAAFAQAVNVDLHSISFHDFSPTEWVMTHNVTATIIVDDQGGSGVNLSSLQWSYSHGTLFEFSDWANLEATDLTNGTLCTVQYHGVEGETNLLRFRGRDVAGNELMSSRVFAVRIDTIPPGIVIVEPVGNESLDPSMQKVRILLTDAGSGVGTVLVATVRDLEAGKEWPTEITVIELAAGSGVFDLSWGQRTGYRLSIDVFCWDRVGNRNSSTFHFTLNRPPAISELEPADGSSHVNGTMVNFTVAWEEPDGDAVSVEWWLGDVLLSREASFGNATLPVGNHTVRISLKDRFSESVGWLNLTIRERPAPPIEPPVEPPIEPPVVGSEEGSPFLWWLVLIVAVAILAGAAVLRRRLAGDGR